VGKSDIFGDEVFESWWESDQMFKKVIYENSNLRAIAQKKKF